MAGKKKMEKADKIKIGVLGVLVLGGAVMMVFPSLSKKAPTPVPVANVSSGVSSAIPGRRETIIQEVEVPAPEVVEFIPFEQTLTPEERRYIRLGREKMVNSQELDNIKLLAEIRAEKNKLKELEAESKEFDSSFELPAVLAQPAPDVDAAPRDIQPVDPFVGFSLKSHSFSNGEAVAWLSFNGRVMRAQPGITNGAASVLMVTERGVLFEAGEEQRLLTFDGFMEVK